LKIEYLKEVVDLAESENFGKTAARFYISQPTLSRHIAQVESELGVQLFTRDDKKTRITPIGKVFCRQIQPLVESYDAIVEEVGRLKRQTPLDLRVYGYLGHSFEMDMLRQAERSLEETYPLMSVELAEIGRVDILEDAAGGWGHEGQVDDGGVYLIPGSESSEYPGFESRRVFRDPLVAIVPVGYRLAQAEHISARDLAGEKVLIPSREGDRFFERVIEEPIGRYCTSCRFVPMTWSSTERVHEFEFEEGVFVNAAGMVSGLMPRSSLLHYRVLTFDEPDVSCYLYAVWKPDENQQAKQLFLDTLDAVVARTLSHPQFNPYGREGLLPSLPES
jgi:DNA-binding transcriptional LysR family regulator